MSYNYFIISVLLLTGTPDIFSQDWKCIIYGDTRNNSTQHKEVLQSMVQNTPDFKFIFNTGDVVDHGDSLVEWEAWHTTFTSIFGTTGQDQSPPLFMATPGNHDATETSAGLINWNNFLSGQKEQYSDGKFDESDGKYFVFDYENVRFVILDSDKSSSTGEQIEMLMNALISNDRQWLIAIWHDPIFDLGKKNI